jgi:succinoglycan biosynthesis transport protein ExoP
MYWQYSEDGDLMSVQVKANVKFPIEGDLTHSYAGERYAQIVDRLLTVGTPPQQLLVTSAGEGEGKTVTAVNLAFAFHARRITVLLAELSFDRPKFAEVFGPSPLRKGIEDVILQGVSLQSTVCVRNDNNLSVAMVNRRQQNNELLSPGARLDNLLSEARSKYDWTILDAPSVKSSSDIKALAATVSLVLLVVRARQTRADELQFAVERIAHPNTLVLLNDI